MAELAASLADRGFRGVDAGLPGGWATDGEWTVCIKTRQPGGGIGARSTLQHDVTVYHQPAGLLSIESEPAGQATDTNHGAAVRRALNDAGYEEDDTDA
jgi:hypothetical protein